MASGRYYLAKGQKEGGHSEEGRSGMAGNPHGVLEK
jgi:hypothetical protein